MVMYRDVITNGPNTTPPLPYIPSIVVTYYHSSKGLYRKSEGEQSIELETSILQRFDLSFFQLSSPENNKCPPFLFLKTPINRQDLDFFLLLSHIL